jgi:hypothetical protein
MESALREHSAALGSEGAGDTTCDDSALARDNVHAEARLTGSKRARNENDSMQRGDDDYNGEPHRATVSSGAAGGGAGPTLTAIGAEAALGPEDDTDDARVPADVMARFHSYYRLSLQGHNFTANLKGKKDFGNPYILDKAIDHLGIHQTGSNYPREVFDPDAFGEEDGYLYLASRQAYEAEQRSRVQTAPGRSSVEFVAGQEASSHGAGFPAGIAGGLAGGSDAGGAGRAGPLSARGAGTGAVPGSGAASGAVLQSAMASAIAAATAAAAAMNRGGGGSGVAGRR